ncbi:MAG: DUF5009 domain-containing protein [Verrucomicrobia bacterium]|nr:DUF5009 domain-containing protein [Verrucomicrobiota bacterium]
MTAPIPPSAPPAKPARLGSLDAYRGLIMLFMASGGMGLAQVAKEFPDSAVWKFLSFHTSHAAWVGGGAWDMIQPSFMFMVGVALPFSVARRTADGQPFGTQFFHALWRSFVLVALAVFLATGAKKQPNFIFTNVLGQIGMGYTFLFLLARRGWKVQLGALAAIAVGYWAAFALHPVAGADLDLKKIGVSPEGVKDVILPGFFAHWSMNANFASGFDRWFLNLFPTEQPFEFNNGGYATLNFVPSLMTMILGLMAGGALRSERTPRDKALWLVKVGAACLVLGLVAGWTLCPIIKRIWTPAWALYSGGIALWLLAAFYWIIDIRGWRAWSWPLVVVGMNSIAIYLGYQLLPSWIRATAKTYLGAGLFQGTYGTVWQHGVVLLVLWLGCWWMYRRKIFLRI